MLLYIIYRLPVEVIILAEAQLLVAFAELAKKINEDTSTAIAIAAFVVCEVGFG